MICPKCGFDGPDGPDCKRCGVVIEKYVRRGIVAGPSPAPAPGVAHTVAPLRAARAVAKPIRKPLGGGIAILVLLLLLGAGGAFAWDAVRLSLRGKDIEKVIRAALAPRQYVRDRLTGEAVYTRIAWAARGDKVDVPTERTFVTIAGENTPTGEVVRITVEILLPTRLLHLVDYPIYRKVEVRLPSTMLPQGYQRFETDPGSQIARDLAAWREKRSAAP